CRWMGSVRGTIAAPRVFCTMKFFQAVGFVLAHVCHSCSRLPKNFLMVSRRYSTLSRSGKTPWSKREFMTPNAQLGLTGAFASMISLQPGFPPSKTMRALYPSPLSTLSSEGWLNLRGTTPKPESDFMSKTEAHASSTSTQQQVRGETGT